MFFAENLGKAKKYKEILKIISNLTSCLLIYVYESMECSTELGPVGGIWEEVFARGWKIWSSMYGWKEAQAGMA